MTHQQPTRASHQSTTSLSTARTSTSSLTLIDNHFSPPSRTGTDSSSDSSSTITSTTSRGRSSTSSNPNRNSSHFHSARPTTSPQTQSQAAILRAREADRQHRLSTRQAEQLRHKGTFTDSGRHSDDWLFGGWSFKDSVRGAWRWAAAGKGNGKEGE